MARFLIQPHFRLQEWVAEEKGYFKEEGLDYEFREQVRSSDGKAHEGNSRPGEALMSTRRNCPRPAESVVSGRVRASAADGAVARVDETSDSPTAVDWPLELSK